MRRSKSSRQVDSSFVLRLCVSLPLLVRARSLGAPRDALLSLQSSRCSAGAPLLRYRSERTLLRVGLLRGVALPLSLGFVVPRRPKKDIDQTRRERCSRREGLRSSSDGAEAGWVFFSGTSRKAQRAPTWGVGSCSEFSYVFLGSNAQ